MINNLLLMQGKEEEMKKDKEWLKEGIESKFHRWYDSAQSLNSLVANVNNLIDQLDEPDVLSQEWIKEPLVPKQEEVYQAYRDGYDTGRQHAIASAKLKLALSIEVVEAQNE